MIASRGMGDTPFGSGNVSTVLDGNGNLTLAVANASTGIPSGIITINPNAAADAAAALNANGLDVVGVLPAGGSGMPAPSSNSDTSVAAQNILNCGTSNCGALSPAPSNYNYTPPSTSAPFCGSGSTQWISGIDNCVLIGVGVLGFVVILALPKGRRR